MSVKHVFYTDNYTKKIADKIAEQHKVKTEFFKIRNPTLNRWGSAKNKVKDNRWLLPSNSMLIGGNRWRHHFALDITDRPIVVIDAHTDMSFDEMILFNLIRPYNWLYFRLLKGAETHLILPYDSFKWGRWDLAIPEKYVDRFNLYSFNKRRTKVKVSLSTLRSKFIEVKDLGKTPPILGAKKQISLDFDITREISDNKVLNLMKKIVREGDVCDVWLDEGRIRERRTLIDHIESCLKIFGILDFN